MKQILAESLVDLRLAVRNVIRQKRRVGFALVIVMGGCISLLLAAGFIQWVLDTMRESTIHSQLGHIQIVRPNYYAKGIADPYKYLLPENSDAEAQVRKHPSVRALAPRLSLVGLISLGDSTLSFMADGVDPVAEQEFAKYFFVEQGERLAADDPTGIVIGQGLAANLGAKVGDNLVLTVTTARGGLNAHDVHIRGIFFTSEKAYDDGAIQLPIELARKLIRVQGATSWLVVLDKTSNTDSVLADLRQRFDPKSFQLAPWYELADFYNKTVTLFLRQVLVVKILIGIIVVLSISNTLSMAVMERTGEIGTIMAMGVRRKSVLRLFILEGLMLGVLGSFVGVVVGWGLSLIISAIGIPMPPPPGMESDFTGEITVNWALALDAMWLGAVTTLIASVVPAWKASRMVIVDALRRQR
mgnify:FL=1